jgi:hypothetical protein
MMPTQPLNPEIPDIEEPPSESPNSPIDTPTDTPIDTPPEVPERQEPGWQAPGADDAPMRMPRDNPDVETEL